MSKLYHEHDKAKKSLIELILQTHEAIEKLQKRGDSANLCGLIIAQRRNLKLLLHKLEKGKGAKK